ncbi:hypothetical protein Tco_1475072 [Tanacetum coccineum]
MLPHQAHISRLPPPLELGDLILEKAFCFEESPIVFVSVQQPVTDASPMLSFLPEILILALIPLVVSYPPFQNEISPPLKGVNEWGKDKAMKDLKE